MAKAEGAKAEGAKAEGAQRSVPGEPEADASPQPCDSEKRLADLLWDYVDRLNAGDNVDPSTIRAEHPEFADELIVELESLTLSRDIPFLIRLIAGPIINNIARESMTRTLESMRERLRLSAVPTRAEGRTGS